ncbi:MAG TPA: ATP-dependent RNA helicase [Bdellovibrionales bacterium]|nr:ATP-dependent RNA helicase [Bdellovibrionales bacterium]
MTFNDYSFEPSVKKGLEELGFTTPTPIQSKSIPLLLEGKDIIGCAETGSGKTGAFSIPFFSKLVQEPEATLLVLTPTRELAQQVGEFFRNLSKFETSITVTNIVGGVDMRKQLQALKRKPRVVVGTPGRVTDHLRRGTLNLKNTKYLILDEGDRMLDMGFAPQLDAILKFLPKQRQTCLFTATLAPKVKALANQYLSKPVHVQVGQTSTPVQNIHQQVIEVDEKHKNDVILDELNQRKGSIIIFLRTKRRTESLYKHLRDYGFKVDHIHGDRSQGQRSTALRRFRDGDSRILCATDVAARGLDIPAVEHVINYDLPMMKEDYLHRIGRTARNGAKGDAVSLVAPQQRREWMSLVQEFKIVGADLEVGPRGRGGPKKKNDRRGPSGKSFSNRSGGKKSFREEREETPRFKKKSGSFSKSE